MARNDRKLLLIQTAAKLTAKGFSPAKVAQELGVSRRTLSRYEATTEFKNELQKIIAKERYTVSAMLTSSSRRAIERVVTELESEDSKTALMAAKILLDKGAQIAENQPLEIQEPARPSKGYMYRGVFIDLLAPDHIVQAQIIRARNNKPPYQLNPKNNEN